MLAKQESVLCPRMATSGVAYHRRSKLQRRRVTLKHFEFISISSEFTQLKRHDPLDPDRYFCAAARVPGSSPVLIQERRRNSVCSLCCLRKGNRPVTVRGGEQLSEPRHNSRGREHRDSSAGRHKRNNCPSIGLLSTRSAIFFCSQRRTPNQSRPERRPACFLARTQRRRNPIQVKKVPAKTPTAKTVPIACIGLCLTVCFASSIASSAA